MEYRQLGGSGLRVPVLSFGTATFGGVGDFFSAWGKTQVAEAQTLIDICLEAGVNLFDTANVYSRGSAEEVLGGADRGPARQGAGVHQGDLPDGRRPERFRRVALRARECV